MIDEKKILRVIDSRKEELEDKFIYELKGLYSILKDGYSLKNRVIATIDKAERLKPLIEEYNRILDFKKHIKKHSDFYSIISKSVAKQLETIKERN